MLVERSLEARPRKTTRKGISVCCYGHLSFF